MLPRRFIALVVLLCLCPAAGAGGSPAEVKAAFLKLLDRPRVALDVRQEGSTVEGGFAIVRASFASEKKADGTIERVPVLLVRPAKAKGRLPAVIVLHGTGGNKEAKGVVQFMQDLAKRGIIGVAIDARYHGGRAGGAKGAAAYHAAIVRAWKSKPGEKHEHPFLYDTCWDLWRTVDYLQKRDDIDPARIGMIGFSMGGMHTYLAASVDERVKVVVPAIAVQSFFWSLANDKWQGRARTIQPVFNAAAKDMGVPKPDQNVCRAVWARIVPGIIQEFDCPSLIRLFAGRSLLILSGTKDGNCPIEGARLAFAAAEKAYKAAGTPERLRIMVANVGHSVTAEQRRAALEWFERWLK
jgi:dienelactone hydrolase